MTYPPTHTPQLSAQNLRELTSARAVLRKINRAVSVARFDGWTMAIFGGLSFLFGLTGDWVSILTGIALVGFAWVELRGAGLLRQLQTRATRMLGLNQLALGAMLTLYAGWQIYAESSGHGTIADMLSSDPEVTAAMEPYQNLTSHLVTLFYLIVIVVAIVGMGLMSRYYFTRTKYIDAYLRETPGWILDLQKAGTII